MKRFIIVILFFYFIAAYAQDNAKVKMFYEAIRANDIEKIELYIYSGISVNYSENKSKVFTPLMVAIDAQKYEAVKFLVESGANVNMGNSKARQEIVARQTSSQRLATVNIPTYPLVLAVKKRNYKVIELLLKNGAKPEVAKSEVKKSNNPKIIDLFSKYGLNHTSNSKDLLSAVESNSISKAKYFIKNGAKASAKCIVVATDKKNKAMIDILLSSGGADINANAHYPRSHPMVDNEMVICAVCQAVRRANFDMLKWLVEEKGASINKTCKVGSGAGMKSSTVSLIELSQDRYHTDRVDKRITEYLALAPARQKMIEAKAKAKRELVRKKEKEKIEGNRLRKEKVYDELYNSGINKFNSKEYNNAINDFLSAKEIKSTKEIAEHIGDCYYELGDFEKAVSWYETLIELSYKSDIALTKRGLSKMRLNNFTDSEKDLLIVIDRANTDSQKMTAHYNIAILYSLKKDSKLAVSHLKKSIKYGNYFKKINDSEDFNSIKDSKGYLKLKSKNER